MNVPDLLWKSLPLLLQFYADFYLKADLQKTKEELKTEYNVPKIKTHDFVIGNFIFSKKFKAFV